MNMQQSARRFITSRWISSISSCHSYCTTKLHQLCFLHSRERQRRLRGFLIHEQNNLIHLLLQFVSDLLLFRSCFALIGVYDYLTLTHKNAPWSLVRDKILIKCKFNAFGTHFTQAFSPASIGWMESTFYCLLCLLQPNCFIFIDDSPSDFEPAKDQTRAQR